MASPLGHSLFAIAIATQFYPKPIKAPFGIALIGFMVIAIVLANAADFDFLLGFLVNDPGRYHRMASHSIFTALASAPLVTWMIMHWRQWPLSLASTWSFSTLLLLSHLIADYVAADGSLPYGMQALWPLDDGWYISPKTILGPFIKGQAGTDILGFFNAMWNPTNVRTLATEFVLGSGLVFLSLMLHAYRHK